MPQEEGERRGHSRLTRRELLSIELRPNGKTDGAPTVVSTRTIDVSADGLRILLPAPVRPDCLFDFCIEVKGHPQRFLLTGEVRWCRPLAGENKYEAGLLIHNGEGTDYPHWAGLF
jgi:hypothetical protein